MHPVPRHRAASAPTTLRRLAGVVAVAAPVCLVSAAIAGAATGVLPSSTPAAPRQALVAEASRLTTEIADQGNLLDHLAERYDAAVIHRAQVTAELAEVTRSLAATDQRVAATRRLVVEQAVAAYIAGAAPLQVVVPGRAGLDPSLTQGYADILSGEQHRALVAYRTLRRDQQAEAVRLTAARRAADVSLDSLRAARTQASGAASADQALLAQLKGHLAVLVAADQRRQAAAAARTERAVVAAQGGLPGGSPATAARSVPRPKRPSTHGAPAGGIPSTTTTAPTALEPTTTSTVPLPVSPPAGPGTTLPPTTLAPPTTPAPTSTLPPTTTPPTTGPGGTGGTISPQAPGASSAIAYAEAQLGKPYQWGGSGPASFDCSGLVMRAWETAGVDFPHLAQDQYDDTQRIPVADLLPGDLVFFGTPDDVYHVGLYVGGGEMIDAPETGQNVSEQSIYWPSLLGGGRVTSSS